MLILLLSLGQNVFNRLRIHFLRKIFISCEQLIKGVFEDCGFKRRLCDSFLFGVDFEEALNRCPIFHVMPVTLAGLEMVRDNSTVPCGFYYVAVVSM